MPEQEICFVISPIGSDETATRKWTDQTIKHLIRPAVEPHGLEVLRADQEDRAGIITTHIIQRLVSSKLVIADLTGRNPNVFYELAVRHVTRKPLVQIIRAEEEIPFDVQSMRTVKFELNDPDTLLVAREALGRQVKAVLEEEQLETPISQAVGQQVAIESGDPSQVGLAELAQAVQALTAEVRQRPAPNTPQSPISWGELPAGVHLFTGRGEVPRFSTNWDDFVRGQAELADPVDSPQTEKESEREEPAAPPRKRRGAKGS